MCLKIFRNKSNRTRPQSNNTKTITLSRLPRNLPERKQLKKKLVSLSRNNNSISNSEKLTSHSDEASDLKLENVGDDMTVLNVGS